MTESLQRLISELRKEHGWSQEQLARELGVSFATVNRWEQGRSYPQTGNLHRLLEMSERSAELGQPAPPAGSEPEPAGAPQDRIVCADSIDALRMIPDDSVHLILSDIPYGIGFEDWDVLHKNENSAFRGSSPAQRRAGSVFRSRGKPINGWSSADRNIPREYYEWCLSWAPEWLRVLKPGGSAIVFAGRRLSPRCVVALEDAGFNFRDLLGWVRPGAIHRAQRLSGVFRRRGDRRAASAWEGWRVGNLRPTFEPIIWCFKPYRITIADNVLENSVGAYDQEALLRHFGGTDNIFECAADSRDKGLHRAQKPLKLMKALIELVTRDGQVVLDPFAGSGTTALAAKELGRRYIAFEVDPTTCELARSRLDQPTPAPPT